MDQGIDDDGISLPCFAPFSSLPTSDNNATLAIKAVLRNSAWAKPDDSEETIILKNLIVLYQLIAHFQDAFTSKDFSTTLPSPLNEHAHANKKTWTVIQSLWLRTGGVKGIKEHETIGLGSLAATTAGHFSALRELHQVGVEDLVEGLAEPRNKLARLLVKLVWEHRRFVRTGIPRYQIAVYDEDEDDSDALPMEAPTVLGERLLSWADAVGLVGSDEQWKTMWPGIDSAERYHEPTYKEIVDGHRKERQRYLQKFVNESSYTLRLPEVQDPYRADQIQLFSTQLDTRKTIRQGAMIISEPSEQKGLTQPKSRITTPQPAKTASAKVEPPTPATILFPRLPQHPPPDPSPTPLTPGTTPVPEVPAVPAETYTSTFAVKQDDAENAEQLILRIHGWREKEAPAITPSDGWLIRCICEITNEQTVTVPGRLDKDVYLALEEDAMEKSMEQWVRFTKNSKTPRGAETNGLAQGDEDIQMTGVAEGQGVDGEQHVSVVLQMNLEKHDGGVVLMEMPEGWDVEGPFLGKYTEEMG